MKTLLRPYFFIVCCGMLAFAPLSFMIRAMKNDVVALEYPINHFISQCIRNGQWPYWFNTWGMGFPLQSNITWSLFSTPQVFFSSVFNYDIYALHAEFMFFILLAGCGMFYFLKRFVARDTRLAQMMAIAYMLSGFMVGSTQWMLYITATAFIPLLLSAILHLLERPCLRFAVLTAVLYAMMFTSVYAALNIITTYGLVLFLLLYFVFRRKEKVPTRKQLAYLGVSAVITLCLCTPCLYFSLEVLNNIERGTSIAGSTDFFNSNYLHPAALSSMLIPFPSVRMNYLNTEGTMLDSYAGLITVALAPSAILGLAKSKDRVSACLLIATILFLLLSFGAFTPLRSSFNILPGFSYFRNPAIFRFYFILALILFICYSLRQRSLSELLASKTVIVCLSIAAMVCLVAVFYYADGFRGFEYSSLQGFIKGMSWRQAIFLGALLQLLLISTILWTGWKKHLRFSMMLLTTDLVINTLICTPFF